MGKRQTIRFVLFALLIGLFAYYLYRYFGIEQFVDQDPPAIRALDKVMRNYTKLEKQLHAKKITEKDNVLYNVTDDLTEKRRLYILKPTNEQEVTYDSLRADLTRYITMYNKMIIDYNLDLLNMNVEEILAEKPYIQPTITTPIFQPSDTYTGKV